MKSMLTELLINRLTDSKDHLKQDFNSGHQIKVARHFVVDNLFPVDIAEKIYSVFPEPRSMHKLSNFGELKFKYCHIKDTDTLLMDVHAAIQDTKVISVIEEITGIVNQIPDQSRYAGGVSTMLKGYFLNPHLDHSHDVDKKYYRTVNVLYYVSPNWKLENGGNYELWDEDIKNCIVIPSLFNRLIVMETNQTSWHAVNRVQCQEPRCCIYNYYFSSQSPTGKDYFHEPSSLFFNRLFRARPEQKARRMMEDIRDKISACIKLAQS